ncbi:DUF2637 domain-containing protein [Micromonospora globbae]|uniref:DUF2637 domain-containing protein n=1 Tax=Micromonospora globbae TaxID=1894969 RepID=UPI00341A761C
MTGTQLRRLRWAVRATLTLGVAASVAANVLHARPNPISQIIAAWPPLALLLTVELISRVPHHRWYLGAIRITAAAVIAVIAAWVSYWHLVGVAARYGESGYGAAYLLPISVDGLVVVASVSLVEITARIRATSAHAVSTATEQRDGPTGAVPLGNQRSSAGSAGTAAPMPATRRPISPRVATATTAALASAKDRDDDPAPPSRLATEQRTPVRATAGDADLRAAQAAGPLPSETMRQPSAAAHISAAPTPGPIVPAAATGAAGYEREEPQDHAAVTAGTAAAVAYWRRRDPGLQPAEIAARIGRSERTVRRYWPQRSTKHTTSTVRR